MSGLWSVGLPPSSLWLRSAHSLPPFPTWNILIAMWDQQLFSPISPPHPRSGEPEPLVTLVMIFEMHSTPLASRHCEMNIIYQASSPKSGPLLLPLWTHSPCLRTCHPHLTRLVPHFPGKGGGDSCLCLAVGVKLRWMAVVLQSMCAWHEHCVHTGCQRDPLNDRLAGTLLPHLGIRDINNNCLLRTWNSMKVTPTIP